MRALAGRLAGRQQAAQGLPGILKGDEFIELQQRAEEKISGPRKVLAENGRQI